jgi:hypothetical protein
MATYKVNSVFPFHALNLNPPYLHNERYLFKLHINHAPVYVQFPIAFSTQGVRIIKQKPFLDLKYDITNMTTIQPWMDLLQSKCIELIHAQNIHFFSKELSQTDLTRLMTPMARPYTEDYNLIRVSLDMTHTGDLSCVIYDEHKNIIQDYHTITSEHSFIPLLLLEGVTITPTSCTINIKVIQLMVYEPVSKDIVCLIDTNDPILPDSINTDDPFSESEDSSVEDDQNILNEVSLHISDPNVMVLKKATDVYYERYKEALIVARKLKKDAMDAHLNAIQIKTSYELEDIELSDHEH